MRGRARPLPRADRRALSALRRSRRSLVAHSELASPHAATPHALLSAENPSSRVPTIAKRRARRGLHPARFRLFNGETKSGLCLAPFGSAVRDNGGRAPPTTSDGGHNGVDARYAIDTAHPARFLGALGAGALTTNTFSPDLLARGARPDGGASPRHPRGSLRPHVSRPASVRPLPRSTPLRPPRHRQTRRPARRARRSVGGPGRPDRRPGAEREQPEQPHAHRRHHVRRPVPRPRRHVRCDVAPRPAEGAHRLPERSDTPPRPRLRLRRRAGARSRALRVQPRQPRAADQAQDRGRRALRGPAARPERNGHHRRPAQR